MSFLALQGLEKTYPDGTRAVRGIDLAIDEGAFVVLLGPSGCGKTTTLRMLAGLEIATGGRIHLDGSDVTSLRPAERDIGFVFQFYALYPHLTVRENLLFPLRAAGLGRKEREQALARVGDRLDLNGLLGRTPRQLSGGDQQRVALGRAMIRRPRLWLMDEPLGQLDADRRVAMREFIREQQQELGVTTVFVTHDQEEAMALADLVVVMRDGDIRQVGSPADLYRDPADTFVAHFVGSPGMNLLAGTVVDAADGRRFRAGAGALDLPTPAPPGAAVLGVRPEGLRFVDADGLPGTVVLDEYQGAWRLVYCDTPAGRVVCRTDQHDPLPIGTAVHLAVAPEACRWYAGDGGDGGELLA